VSTHAAGDVDNDISYDDFMKVLTSLSPKRANARDDWVGGCKGIKHVGQCNKFTPRQILILGDEFSKLCPEQYDADAVMRLMAEELPPHDTPKNLRSFIAYLKEDNPAVYHVVFDPVLPYEKVKTEFEKTFFKVMSPLLYVQVKNQCKLDIKNRSDFFYCF
jgi:hypothetical protein